MTDTEFAAEVERITKQVHDHYKPVTDNTPGWVFDKPDSMGRSELWEEVGSTFDAVQSMDGKSGTFSVHGTVNIAHAALHLGLVKLEDEVYDVLGDEEVIVPAGVAKDYESARYILVLTEASERQAGMPSA